MLPLVWVVSSGEQSEGYHLAPEVLLAHTKHLRHMDLAVKVRQFHADLTTTKEKARVAVLPVSIRAADFWHTLERIKEKLVRRNEHDGLKHYRSLLSWVHTCRNRCTTLTEHHDLWPPLCKHYESDDIAKKAAVDALRDQYCLRIPLDVTSKSYGVTNPLMLGKSMCCVRSSGAACSA